MEQLGDRSLSDFISVTEAMQCTGLKRAYITRLLREKRIEGVKLTGNWLVYSPSLERYMAHRRGPGRPRKQSAR